MASPIKVEYQGRVAIITIDNDTKLNALNQSGYYDLAQALREVATHDEVFITLLIGKGRYFSAYATPVCLPPLFTLTHTNNNTTAVPTSPSPAPPPSSKKRVSTSNPTE